MARPSVSRLVCLLGIRSSFISFNLVQVAGFYIDTFVLMVLGIRTVLDSDVTS